MKHLWNSEIDALSFDRPWTGIVFKLLFLIFNKLARNDSATFELGEVKLGEDVKSDRNRVVSLVCNRSRSFYRISSKRHFAKTNDWRRNSDRHFVYRRSYGDFDRIQIADIYDDVVLKNHKSQ